MNELATESFPDWKFESTGFLYERTEVEVRWSLNKLD